MGLFLIYLKIFLTNRQQYVSVDGNFSQFKPVVSGVPQDSVLGPLLFILYTANMWNDLEIKMILYADNTTCMLKLHLPKNWSYSQMLQISWK